MSRAGKHKSANDAVETLIKHKTKFGTAFGQPGKAGQVGESVSPLRSAEHTKKRAKIKSNIAKEKRKSAAFKVASFIPGSMGIVRIAEAFKRKKKK